MMKIKKILFFAFIFFVSGVSYANLRLTIVHMNDTHGHIENLSAIAKQIDKIRVDVQKKVESCL